MIIVGEDDRSAASDAKTIHSRLERLRTDQDPKNPDLVYLKPNTTLQGTQLINVPGLPLRDYIGVFIEQRLVRKSSEFPWTERTSPL